MLGPERDEPGSPPFATIRFTRKVNAWGTPVPRLFAPLGLASIVALHAIIGSGGSTPATNPCGDGDSGGTWQEAYYISRGVACPSNSVNDSDPDRRDWYRTTGCPSFPGCADVIKVKVCAQTAPNPPSLGGVWASIYYKYYGLDAPTLMSNPLNLVLSGSCTLVTGTATWPGSWYISIGLGGIGRIKYSLCLDDQADTGCPVA